MTTTTAVRARYAADAVATASPARLLTMLYDRLCRDLTMAREAVANKDVGAAHDQLVHAQAIVQELRSSLDVTVWDGAAGLAALYDFLLQELVVANVAKDTERITSCLDVVEPLRDAWRQAALATLAS